MAVPSVFWFVGGNDPDRYAEAKAAGKLNEFASAIRGRRDDFAGLPGLVRRRGGDDVGGAFAKRAVSGWPHDLKMSSRSTFTSGSIARKVTPTSKPSSHRSADRDVVILRVRATS
jgi:hypothetical protein